MYLIWGRAIPVSVQGNFLPFLLKLVQTGFCLSSKQANSQLSKTVVFTVVKICGLKISLALDLIMAALLKDPRRKLCVGWGLTNERPQTEQVITGPMRGRVGQKSKLNA